MTRTATDAVDAHFLRTFRLGFGLMMLASIVRFWTNGWIEKLYLEPRFHFSYDYFEWVKPLGDWTYALFILAGLSALGIAFGKWYRAATIVFFLSFTYIELMDKTTYLNHYYFISLLSLLLVFLPNPTKDAGVPQYYGRANGQATLPRWTLWVLRLFVGTVYFYAGLAKLNSDWLLEAMPLAIWLPAEYSVPLLGDLLQQRWVHYAFAWSGAAYDLTIPFLLLWKPTRYFAFALVVVFHVLTRVLFPIGMFPYVMIVSALVFFDPDWHRRRWDDLRRVAGRPSVKAPAHPAILRDAQKTSLLPKLAIGLLIAFHLLFPWRYLLHPGELFWTEEGFRYSWRVMLIEKAGLANFTVIDGTSGERHRVNNTEFLTGLQQKQMATQPDFILEYAHFLAEEYRARGVRQPEVYVDSYVALNGRLSQVYVRPDTDLARLDPATARLEWLMPFKDTIYGL